MMTDAFPTRNLMFIMFDLFAGVPFPPSRKLSVAEVFDTKTGKPRPDVLKQHFILDGRMRGSRKWLHSVPSRRTLLHSARKRQKNRRGKKERKEANEK